MKKLIIVILLILLITYCSYKSEYDDSFKSFYNEKLNKIIIYDSITELDNPIPTDDWIEFYENTNYLYLLTGHKFRFDRTEPPGYPSQEILELDIKELKEWYYKNGNNMSIQKADSIVNMKCDSLGGGVFYYKGIRYESNNNVSN